MDISIFEIIGPVMMGPSSSGTAGMARLGAVAHKFIDEPIKSIDLRWCPQYGEEYYSCRSHLGIIGGMLGINEYDIRLRNALDYAKEQGIELSTSLFEEPLPPHPLSVGITAKLASGKTFELIGMSVGGGSIQLLELDGFKVDPGATEAHLFIWSDADVSAVIAQRLPEGQIHGDEKDGRYLYYVSLEAGRDGKALEQIFDDVPAVTKVRFIEPFIPLGFIPHKPLFTSFDELIALSEKTGKNVAQLAVDYEINRTGRSEEEIRADMKQRLDIMRRSAEIGLQGVQSLCGFDPGDVGKRLLAAYNEGRTFGGSVLPKAIAIGIAIMEVDQSMGVVVATPTGGSAGIIPGPLFVLQEEHSFSDDDLVDALLVCAAMGVIIYFHGSTFSGSAGGCQAEVGISSGITAAAIAFLGGADTKLVCHACALSIKNILGLVCDPLRGSCEVPCIKRNGVGIANAFAAADMAIAGIESFIPPDEVIDSFVDIQKKMPKEMRAGNCGAPNTPTGKAAQARIREICRDILLPEMKDI